LSFDFFSKTLERLWSQENADVLGEATITVCDQSHRADHGIVESLTVETCHEASQSFVDVSFLHEEPTPLAIVFPKR